MHRRLLRDAGASAQLLPSASLAPQMPLPLYFCPLPWTCGASQGGEAACYAAMGADARLQIQLRRRPRNPRSAPVHRRRACVRVSISLPCTYHRGLELMSGEEEEEEKEEVQLDLPRIPEPRCSWSRASALQRREQFLRRCSPRSSTQRELELAAAIVLQRRCVCLSKRVWPSRDVVQRPGRIRTQE